MAETARGLGSRQPDPQGAPIETCGLPITLVDEEWPRGYRSITFNRVSSRAHLRLSLAKLMKQVSSKVLTGEIEL